MGRFKLGRAMMSAAVAREMSESAQFRSFVSRSLRRHANCDWGDLDPEDKAANEMALKDGSRIWSAYKCTNGIKIWIITEFDRSHTTILFPEDY